MRSEDDIVEPAQRTVVGQRLAIVDIEARTPELAFARAAMSAASSTIGPRDVLIRIAVGFIRASSSAPMRPRVRSLSTT